MVQDDGVRVVVVANTGRSGDSANFLAWNVLFALFPFSFPI